MPANLPHALEELLEKWLGQADGRLPDGSTLIPFDNMPQAWRGCAKELRAAWPRIKLQIQLGEHAPGCVRYQQLEAELAALEKEAQ